MQFRSYSLIVQAGVLKVGAVEIFGAYVLI